MSGVPQAYRFRQNNSRKRTREEHRRSRYESLKDAIAQRDRGSIIWLINEGCPVNNAELDKLSDSPLHIAVFVNDIDVARILISAGAEVNVVNLQKLTPLHLAFEMGNTPMVDLLLSQCNGKQNLFTVYGLSHFHIACVRNNWRVAHAFLECGVNANVYLEKCFYGKDYVYYRPLHLAVKYENLEVTELLLKYGANVDAKDRYKRTPLHLACRYNYKRIREAIESGYVKSPDDLMYLIKHENYQEDVLRTLVRYGAGVDALDANETPPVFHVFKCDYREIQSYMRERIQMEDEDFWSEIIEEIKSIQREKFYALIQCDANVKFTNDFKETLLHLVIDGKKLFNNCSSLATKDRDLPDEDKAEIVDLLLKYGADPEAKNSSGQTALQMAMAAYYPKTVKTLLNHFVVVSNVCFFHYKVPKRDAGQSFNFGDMENFLDIVGLMLKRKSDLNLGRSNELLLLRYMSLESSIQHLENCSVADLRHLLDFGDINSMNLSLSEHTVLSNRDKVTLLLEHARKLELAGLRLDEAVKREFLKCERVISGPGEEFDERCRNEIGKLKLVMIDRYASFYDLLFLNASEVAVRVNNESFRRAVRTYCGTDFALYDAMIMKQFVKGLVRSILLESAKEYFTFIIKVELPEPCLENIISHLKNVDLCNLALAFE